MFKIDREKSNKIAKLTNTIVLASNLVMLMPITANAAETTHQISNQTICGIYGTAIVIGVGSVFVYAHWLKKQHSDYIGYPKANDNNIDIDANIEGGIKHFKIVNKR